MLRKTTHCVSKSNLMQIVFASNPFVSGCLRSWNKCLTTSSIKLNSTKSELKKLEQVPDESFDYPLIDVPKNLPLQPIRYGISLTSDKVEKTGSFIGNLFMGKFDHDFLKYPSILYSRKEFNIVRQQYEMVRQHFNKIFSEPNAGETLYKLGFQNLWLLSKTEMTNLFEAVGAAFNRPYQVNSSESQVTASDGADANEIEPHINSLFIPDTQRELLNLFLRNMIGGCVAMADNKPLADKLKALLLAGKKIGFAWTEKPASLASLPYTDWESVAELNDDRNVWTVTGQKCNIKHDNYDYYLLFCRTSHYPEDERPLHMLKPSDTNPGMVTFLVPRQLVNVQLDSTLGSNEQYQYQTIRFENLVLKRDEYELFEPEEFGSLALSIRGLGHLNSSAILLGMLKGLQKEVYEYLRCNRLPLLNCEIVQQKLCDLTAKVYTIESMLYLTSATYDAFKMESWPDMSLETACTKIVTIEYARDFLNIAQSLMGSQMLNISKYHDIVNLLDSFLDNAVHHRLMLAMSGLHLVGQYKHEVVQTMNLSLFFPGQWLKYFWRQRHQRNDDPTLDLDLRGYVHPTLVDQADQLEYSVKRFEFATESILILLSKKVATKQSELWKLSQIACNLYAMTSVLSRANRAYTETVQNSDTDLECATVIIQKLWMDNRELVHDLLRTGDRTPDVYNQKVHAKNMEFGGYFAYSPLDKFFY